MGHTEDALPGTLNHFYFVSAHIISDKPEGKWGVQEEKFTSLCYAGHLPGYTMNYNHHGLVFSINTLSARNLQPGKTRRIANTIKLDKIKKNHFQPVTSFLEPCWERKTLKKPSKSSKTLAVVQETVVPLI